MWMKKTRDTLQLLIVQNDKAQKLNPGTVTPYFNFNIHTNKITKNSIFFIAEKFNIIRYFMHI